MMATAVKLLIIMFFTLFLGMLITISRMIECVYRITYAPNLLLSKLLIWVRIASRENVRTNGHYSIVRLNVMQADSAHSMISVE